MLRTMDVEFKPGMRVFCVGAGGIGLSAVMQWLSKSGIEVSGCDRVDSEILQLLREKNIPVTVGENIDLPEKTDLLIYSDAVPKEHLLRNSARKKGIKECSYAESLGILTRNFRLIAVSGTHGKSTTTALIAHIFKSNGFDPTVVVGTKMPELDNNNFYLGKSDIAIVEADEYRSHFLYLEPYVGVVTNIDYDHVDAFPTPELYRDAFLKFAEKIKKGGFLVVPKVENGRLLKDKSIKEMVFCLGSCSDLEHMSVAVSGGIYQGGVQYFSVKTEQGESGSFSIQLPGEHVLLDAAAAISTARAFNIPMENIKNSIENFTGTWRRFERVGDYKGSPIISDYGHHPTEICALLQATRQAFPKHKVLLVFQSHHGSRTKTFSREFVNSLALADEVVILEMYGVAGREKDGQAVSTKGWADELKLLGKSAFFVETSVEAEEIIKEKADSSTIVLIAGAGDIDELARKLVLK